MNSYIDWLLKPEKMAKKFRKTILFFYMTFMAIPGFLAYCYLLYITFNKLQNDIYRVFGILIGIAWFIFMIFRLSEERSEVQELRNKWFDFSDEFVKDWNKCSENTHNQYREFQDIFVKICPRQIKIPEVKKTNPYD